MDFEEILSQSQSYQSEICGNLQFMSETRNSRDINRLSANRESKGFPCNDLSGL